MLLLTVYRVLCSWDGAWEYPCCLYVQPRRANTHADSLAEFHFQRDVQECKAVRTVKMFYRLWRVDLRAEELKCWKAEAFTSRRRHIVKDKLMGS